MCDAMPLILTARPTLPEPAEMRLTSGVIAAVYCRRRRGDGSIRSTCTHRASLALSRSYGPEGNDPAYEEGGIDYPIVYVRWPSDANMEASSICLPLDR